MNLRGLPYPIDFVGNAPSFKVYASPFTLQGRHYTHTFVVHQLPAGDLFLRTPYFTLNWTITADNKQHPYIMHTANTAVTVYEQLSLRILHNHTINGHYDVTMIYDSNGCTITFTDKERRSYDDLMDMFIRGQDALIETVSVTNGITPVAIPDYSVWAKLIIYKESQEVSTPELSYTPSGNMVEICTDIIRPYFSGFDRPAYRETFGAYNCDEVVRSVRLLYAERRGSEVGLVKSSEEVILINGTLDRYAAKNNIPDWDSMSGKKFFQLQSFDIFGQDNNDEIRTHFDTEQYIYLIQPRPNAEVSVFVSINRNGTTIVDQKQLTLGEGLIVRIPVSMQALGIQSPETVTSYSVAISTPGSRGITRLFIVEPKPYNGQTLLLLNRMNLYEAFNIESLVVERSTDGEEVTIDRTMLYSISGTGTVITARTGWKTNKEMRRLTAALSARENMVLDGQYGFLMSMIPNTYTITNEAEDLIEAEIQFVITEKINREPIYFTAVADDLDFAETIISPTSLTSQK